MSICYCMAVLVFGILLFTFVSYSLKPSAYPANSQRNRYQPQHFYNDKPCIIPPKPTKNVYFGKEIFSVADLHGDFNAAVRILTHAGLIGETLDWIGGDSILVQTGDIVDRGDDGRKIYDLFLKLTAQAREAGGKVLQLLGNHETMNLLGDYRYVSRRDMQAFGGHENRTMSFQSGAYAYLSDLPTAVIVNDTLFAHAGVDPDVAELGLDVINDVITSALKKSKQSWNGLEMTLLKGNISPHWTREFEPRSTRRPGYHELHMCEKVEETLGLLGAKRMVIGHNVQRDLTPRSRCNGMLFSMDCGIAEFYGGGFGYLKLSDSKAEIIHLKTEDVPIS